MSSSSSIGATLARPLEMGLALVGLVVGSVVSLFTACTHVLRRQFGPLANADGGGGRKTRYASTGTEAMHVVPDDGDVGQVVLDTSSSSEACKDEGTEADDDDDDDSLPS